MKLQSAVLCAMVAMSMAIIPTAVSIDPSCGTQFTDANAPDNDSCRYRCNAGQLLTISVDASDTDATASGSTRCGNGYAPCTQAGGRNHCYGEGGPATSASDKGACDATVDEFWNSAWSYQCAAKDPPQPPCPPPCEPRDPGTCILGIICCPPWLCTIGTVYPPKIVINTPGAPELCAIYIAAGVVPDPGSLVETGQKKLAECNIELPTVGGTDAASGLPAGVTSQIDVWIVNGKATGRLCNAGEGCWEILPLCATHAGGRSMSCSVGEVPNVLGPAPRFVP